jgi:hypothetical protein
MHNAADHAAVIHPRLASDIRWQMRFAPALLLFHQPNQLAAHYPRPLSRKNHYRINHSRVRRSGIGGKRNLSWKERRAASSALPHEEEWRPDFRLHKKSKVRWHPETIAVVDSGYHGL